MKYPVNEFFATLQGEGVYTGVPAVFLRLQGCPIGCPWCDTQHTWEHRAEDEIPVRQMLAKTSDTAQWSSLSAEELLAEVEAAGWRARHLVITGGEPCLYDLRPLAAVFEPAGWQLQVETSGTFQPQVSRRTWVTVSPKINMPGGYPVLGEAMGRADEIKHPIARQSHLDALDELLAQHPVKPETTISLQPISQQQRATELAIKTCQARNWRLSVQLHKYLQIA